MRNASKGKTTAELPKAIQEHPDNYLTLRNRFIRRSTLISTLTLALSFASIVLAFVAVIITFRTQRNAVDVTTKTQRDAVKLTTDTQRQLKEIDLRQSFQERYNKLTAETASSVKNESDAKGYYRSYWRLQLEEYQYWCDGMINEDLYATWAESRRSDWEKNLAFKYNGGSFTYQQGWQYMKNYFIERDRGKHTQYERFVKFFDEVIFGSETSPTPRDHCGKPASG